MKIGNCGQRGWATALASLVVVGWMPAQDVGVDEKIEGLRRAYEHRLEQMRSEYEGRIATLERSLSGVQGDLERTAKDAEASRLEDVVNALTQEVQRKGLADLSQTTLFDNRFNPAVSVVADFILSASDRDDSYEDLNRFHLRDLELGFVGRVDPMLAYYVYIHFDEEEVELEEAFGIADQWLPDTFSLKFGRFNLDFGKQSILHEHHLPYVDKPLVLQEFLGGSLRGTGFELHHWFPVGDDHLIRWSVGMVNGLDGDAHPIVGPLAGEHHHGDEEGAEPFGERSFDDFSFHGRITALFELSAQSTLQVGSSVAYAPGARQFREVGITDGLAKGALVRSAELERLLVGFDVTFTWLDETTGRGLNLGAEFLLSRQDVLPEEEEEGLGALVERDVTSLGFYAWGEYLFSPFWSVGVRGGWVQHAEDDAMEAFDVGAFVTWKVNEFNRLRLEALYLDDDENDDPFFAVLVQWTIILGSHGHGINW